MSAFDLEPGELEARARVVLEGLLSAEAATLLLPGAAFERSQLVPQLVSAMRELHRFLRANGWRIAAVEERVTAQSRMGPITGRLDLRLVNARGLEAVLDLKWGASSYRASVERGHAVQLALYARAIQKQGSADMPPAGYFSLSSGRVITTDHRLGASRARSGPTLEDTLRRVENTAEAVRRSLGAGTVLVAATAAARPMLEALGVPHSEHIRHHALSTKDAACMYCDFPAICGRSWERIR